MNQECAGPFSTGYLGLTDEGGSRLALSSCLRPREQPLAMAVAVGASPQLKSQKAWSIMQVPD